MATYRLARSNNVDLVFDGELLVRASSREDPDQLRWTEIAIVRTDTGLYVTQVVGETVVPGETARSTVLVHETPEGVRGALQRRTRGHTFMSNVALDALEEATARDPAFMPALVERI
jgi:hypothetical protein